MSDLDPARPISLETEADLEELIADQQVVLLELYTEGCGLCQQMEPVLGLVARETEATVATINPREDPPLIDRFDVRSVPLLVCFVDGEPVSRLADGFVDTESVLTWLEDATG